MELETIVPATWVACLEKPIGLRSPCLTRPPKASCEVTGPPPDSYPDQDIPARQAEIISQPPDPVKLGRSRIVHSHVEFGNGDGLRSGKRRRRRNLGMRPGLLPAPSRSRSGRCLTAPKQGRHETGGRAPCRQLPAPKVDLPNGRVHSPYKKGRASARREDRRADLPRRVSAHGPLASLALCSARLAAEATGRPPGLAVRS